MRGIVGANGNHIMGIFYRLLGLMSCVDEILGAIVWLYVIPLNWILFAIIFCYFLVGASALGLPWPKMPFEIPLSYPGLQTALAFSALALQVFCWVRRDLIFRPKNFIGGGDDKSQAPNSVRPQEIDMQITGRFDRGSGRSFSLRDCPVRWNIDHTGAILLGTELEHFEEFGFLYTAGPWSLVVPRDTLIGGAQEGTLYSGFSARPAFRLNLPSRRTTAILSVKNASQLAVLRSMFDELIAVSAATEAEFFRAKIECDSEPAPTRLPAQSDGHQVKPAEETSWDDVFGISR